MATTAFLQKAYLAYFGRPVDFTGTTAFANSTELQVQNAFSASAESQALYGSTFGAAQINAIYLVLFGRAAEPAGLAYWSNQVQLGLLTPAGAAVGILNGALNADAIAVTNKLDASAKFTIGLDTTAKILGYSGNVAAASARDFLATVTATPVTPAQVDSGVSVAVVAGTANTNAGTTFTLTAGIDNIVGTSGNDTVIGNFTGDVTNSVQAGDQINGGAGTDTLKLFGTYAAANIPLTITSVETINFANPGDNAVISTAGYSGVTKVQIDQVSSTGGTFALTTGAGQTVQLSTLANAGAGGLVTLTGNATDAAQTVTLSGFQGATGATATAVTATGAANTTLNIVSNTAANKVSTLTTAATTTSVVVTGDKALSITALSGAAIKTVDASAATGAVVVNVDAANATLSFKGGTGNDTVTFGSTNTFTSADAVDGGAGVDTLEIQRAQAIATTKFTNITNVETLKVTNATTAGDVINLDNFGVQNISFGAASTATTTVTNIASGATLSLAAAGTTALTIKADGAADSLAIKVAGAGVTYTVDASQFETLTLDASAQTGAGTFALTDAQLKSVTVVNTTATGTNPDFGLNLGTLGPVVSTVNLSAFKAATAANGVTVTLSSTAVNGATVTGSQNHDTITGSSQVDTIITGANGADITAGAGADVINLTASVAKSDLITLVAAADSNQAGYDRITGFTNSATAAVADKIDFLGTVFVASDLATAQGTGTTNLTATVANGLLTFAGSAAATVTLAQEILAAQTIANVAANTSGANAGVLTSVAFVFGGDTYVYNSGATTATTDDSMVQLVGVTSAIALSTAASTATSIFIS